MVELCHWATAHWMRFAAVETAGTLDLSGYPAGAASWQIGPDGEVADDGGRMPSAIWCSVALYQDRADAERAFDNPAAFLPFLDRATEHWHAFLLPIGHRGSCNHLAPEAPGPMIAPSSDDPTGPLVVMTTAGFDRGPDFDLARVIDFRRNVDRVRESAPKTDGNLAHHVFVPYQLGRDGFTMTIWRDDAAAAAFAYKPGDHRTQMERYKTENTADRTSFTRFRALRSKGEWEGRDPVEAGWLQRR